MKKLFGIIDNNRDGYIDVNDWVSVIAKDGILV